jgi:hypothetical protein
LLATALRSWPEWAEGYRVNGVRADATPSKADIHALREGALNRFFPLDGSLYVGPGDGVMSTGVPLRVVRAQDRIGDFVEQLAAALADAASQYRSHAAVREVAHPRFDLRLYHGGLGLFEPTSKTLFQAEPSKPAAHRQGLLGLSDLLVPPWCLPQVRAAKIRFDELWCEPATPRAEDAPLQ